MAQHRQRGRDSLGLPANPAECGRPIREDQQPDDAPREPPADVDATANKIQTLGGSVCVPPTDIPQTGRFAVVGDPQGAFFSLFKGLPESPGFDPDLPVPGRICWNELLTNDDEAAVRFYGTLFGWRGEPKDIGEMGTYHVQALRGKEDAGIMKNTENGMPEYST